MAIIIEQKLSVDKRLAKNDDSKPVINCCKKFTCPAELIFQDWSKRVQWPEWCWDGTVQGDSNFQSPLLTQWQIFKRLEGTHWWLKTLYTDKFWMFLPFSMLSKISQLRPQICSAKFAVGKCSLFRQPSFELNKFFPFLAIMFLVLWPAHFRLSFLR